MDTDLQPIAEQTRLTRKVNAFRGLHQCLSMSICGFIVSTAVFGVIGTAARKEIAANRWG